MDQDEYLDEDDEYDDDYDEDDDEDDEEEEEEENENDLNAGSCSESCPEDETDTAELPLKNNLLHFPHSSSKASIITCCPRWEIFAHFHSFEKDKNFNS